MSKVTLAATLDFTAVEELDTAVDGASRPTITHNAFNVSGKFNADSTPKVDAVSPVEYTLVAGVKTIDLRALLHANGAIEDHDTKKVVGMLVIVPSVNTTVLTIGKGATNGYPIFGANSIELPIGSDHGFLFRDGLSAISGTAKTIDVAGTGTEKFKVMLILG